MAFDQQVTCVLNGTMGGKPIVQVLAWATETQSSELTSIDVGTYFNVNIWALLQGLLHESYTLASVTCEVNSADPQYQSPTFEFLINETGNIVISDAPPTFLSAVLVKVPDNTTIDPVGNKEFRAGRLSFAGMPEGDMNAGFLTNAALTGWQTLADALVNVSIPTSGANADLQLFMFREPNTLVPPNPTRVNVYVSSVVARQRLGTQNSRK